MTDSLKIAFEKIKYYCSYQERCHSEVKDKLYSMHLTKPEVEYLVACLIEENFLNEERFAIAYAGGKFRIKNWGKEKIKNALQQKQVSKYCINKALQQIDDEDYEKTFLKLAEMKLSQLKSEKNVFIRKRKMQDFLLQKGYEKAMIYDWLKNL